MKKKEEVEKAWVNRANSVFVRPTRQTGYYLKGIEDFKLALRAEIEKQINLIGIPNYNDDFKSGQLDSLQSILKSIDEEIKPLEK